MTTKSKFTTFFPESVEEGKQSGTFKTYISNKKSYFFLKRFIDILVSALILTLVMSWLLPTVAILIKLNSRGPIFFSQRRVGFAGIPFTCIKFRTMFVNYEADAKQAKDNDERITKIGKFLRESNLDEFPQFFNVLAGHMSIVGPRPHMYADCNYFSSIVTGYKFRNFMKPGITGLAQVKGLHGPTPDDDHIFRRYQWDTFYIRNASMNLDWRIIKETIVQLLSFYLEKL